MQLNRTTLIATASLSLAALAIAVFLFSPLFYDITVDEPFPTRADVVNMDHQDREVAMQKVMQKMKGKPDTKMDERLGTTTEEVYALIREGQFSDADDLHQGEGKALLYQTESGAEMIRLEQFRVTNGPALVVYLARHQNPQNADDVKQGYVKLGALKGNVGNQNYTIPATAVSSMHGSIVIWCELFDVLFSAAPLNSPQPTL